MDYYFGDFHFKADQFILISHNKTVNLRVNEGKLLALLISQPERIFSKDIILDTVWAGKVVAEQSIFQNISNLRSILGNDAIITHPKKGYQWQLALKSAPVPPQKASQIIIKKIAPNRLTLAVVLACIAFCLGVLFSLINMQKSADNLPIISVMPTTFDGKTIKNEFAESHWVSLADALSNSSSFNVTHVTLDKTNEFQPLVTFAAQTKNNNADLVLRTNLKKLNSEFILYFDILSANHTWKGMFIGATQEEIMDKITKHIDTLITSKFLTSKKENPKHIHSQLQLLQSKYPEDINILHQFIRNALRNNLLNEAQLLIIDLQQLALTQQNKPYLATVFRLSSEVFIQQDNYEQATIQLHNAKALYSEIGDEIGIADVKQQHAQIAHALRDYPATMQFMQQSISIYEQEKAYLKQFHALVQVSVYANKADKINDRDFYIAEAKRIQKIHHLPKQLLARIYFQQGLFTERVDNLLEAEKFYREVLALYNPEQNSWHKERAQYHLAELLMRSYRISEAVDIFVNEGELTAKENIILSTIYYKGKKYQPSISLAKKVYRNAVLTSDMLAALDAALLLINLSDFDQNLSRKTYVDFIIENSIPFFVYFNENSLKELGLHKQLTADSVNTKR